MKDKIEFNYLRLLNLDERANLFYNYFRLLVNYHIPLSLFINYNFNIILRNFIY
jgi:hypothetical protein